MRTIFSEETDPDYNLALEEVLVRSAAMRPSLLLYCNDRSIVLGNHQAVTLEVDLFRANRDRVPIYRRVSGGGTVYHDGGNLNIAIIEPRDASKVNRYDHLFDPVIALLAKFGVEARYDDRNSLLIDEGRKISGSAQFLGRNMMLTHGTLLFDADLEGMSGLLRPPIEVKQTRATRSVPMPVANVRSRLPHGSSLATLQRTIADRIAWSYGSSVIDAGVSDVEESATVALARTKYSTWQWRIGRSPASTVICRDPRHGSVSLAIDGGIVTKAGLTDPGGEGGPVIQWRGSPIDEVLVSATR